MPRSNPVRLPGPLPDEGRLRKSLQEAVRSIFVQGTRDSGRARRPPPTLPRSVLAYFAVAAPRTLVLFYWDSNATVSFFSSSGQPAPPATEVWGLAWSGDEGWGSVLESDHGWLRRLPASPRSRILAALGATPVQILGAEQPGSGGWCEVHLYLPNKYRGYAAARALPPPAELDTLMEQLISTLMHELIHCEQQHQSHETGVPRGLGRKPRRGEIDPETYYRVEQDDPAAYWLDPAEFWPRAWQDARTLRQAVEEAQREGASPVEVRELVTRFVLWARRQPWVRSLSRAQQNKYISAVVTEALGA